MTLSRKTKLGFGIGCGALILAFGITAAVLGAKAYFGFDEPCIDLYDLQVKNLEFGSPEDSDSGVGGLLGSLVNGVTESLGIGSLLGDLGTQATMEIELQLEVNNTNSYDMDYEQCREGLITIPRDIPENMNDVEEQAVDSTTSEENSDFVIGTWEIPSGTLKKGESNIIPVSIVATIDLLGSDVLSLASAFATNGPLMFEITGCIEGEGWFPGVGGNVQLLCMARLENSLNAVAGTEDASVRCRHKMSIGRRLRQLQSTEGAEEYAENLWALLGEDEEVEERCIV